MLDDNLPPTDDQARQIAAGQYLAMSNAVHALIATHPNPKAFSDALDAFDRETSQILLLSLALQHDDGMRQTYGEVMRSLRLAIHPA